MKRKVKKYAGGMLTDSSGNPVRSSSGEPVRTRSADEIAEDNKRPFGSYATKSSKPSIAEDRPMAGADDYASMGKRAGATSTWSGEDMSPRLRASKEETEEAPTGIASGFKSGESKFERKDNEVKMPAVKKKVTPKVESKRASQSFPLKDEASGSQSFPLRGSIGAASSSALTRAGTESRTPDVMGTSRTRAGTVIPGRTEPNKEDVDKAMSSLADRIRKQDQENTFSFKPSKSPNRSYKAGGKITKMASGGKVSTASSRGDGIAQRGKTKGRMC